MSRSASEREGKLSSRPRALPGDACPEAPPRLCPNGRQSLPDVLPRAVPGDEEVLMSVREVIFLGTASQVPTRHRNHNSLLLLWDDLGILFDPGEGTQRQMTLAGISAAQITHIAVTHFHGDHCLGLAGVIQRLSLDEVPHPVE